jgi:hypothetical protein
MPDNRIVSPPGATHVKYELLIETARKLPPVGTAIAHPCDQVSLESAAGAAKLGLIAPILVGPKSRIQEVAARWNLDISGMPIVDAEHRHDSAAKAVEQVRCGAAAALMKGSLHTDELMGAVVSRSDGIRTARRISHCFIMDVPNHADALIITDAAVNIAPSLDDKVDIIQNAIDLAHAMRVPEGRWRVSIPHSTGRRLTWCRRSGCRAGTMTRVCGATASTACPMNTLPAAYPRWRRGSPPAGSSLRLWAMVPARAPCRRGAVLPARWDSRRWTG